MNFMREIERMTSGPVIKRVFCTKGMKGIKDALILFQLHNATF